jgi:hypothetical protein
MMWRDAVSNKQTNKQTKNKQKTKPNQKKNKPTKQKQKINLRVLGLGTRKEPGFSRRGVLHAPVVTFGLIKLDYFCWKAHGTAQGYGQEGVCGPPGIDVKIDAKDT